MENFDLKTHIRDGKSGVLKSTNHYRMHVQGGEEFFERPINSGNLWYRNGAPAGRVVPVQNEITGVIRNDIRKDEPHVAYNPPPTKDQVLARQLAQKDGEIVELRRQMAELEKQQIAAESAGVKSDAAPKVEVEVEVNGQSASLEDLKQRAEAESDADTEPATVEAPSASKVEVF